MKVSIIMYHYVREIEKSLRPGIKGLELAAFQRQLDYFKEVFNVVTAEELIAAARSGSRLPERACWLTFDDGYRDHLDYVLPELKSRELQGTFFPPALPILEKQMLDVNCIHYILSECPDIQVLNQSLRDHCRDIGMTNSQWQDYWEKFAFPFGYDSKETIFFKRMLQRCLPLDHRRRITKALFEEYVELSEKDSCNELYLTMADLRTLVVEGMFIGSHTYRHEWLDALSSAEQEEEIDRSLAFLADVGGNVDNWIMSYPYGAYNQATLDALAKRNCALAVTTKVAWADLALEHRLALSRFDTNNFPQ